MIEPRFFEKKKRFFVTVICFSFTYSSGLSLPFSPFSIKKWGNIIIQGNPRIFPGLRAIQVGFDFIRARIN